MAGKENKSENKVSDNNIGNIEAGGDVYIGTSEQNIDSKNTQVEGTPSNIGSSSLTGLLSVYRFMYENLSSGQQIGLNLLMILLGGGGMSSLTVSGVPPDISAALGFFGTILFLFGVGYFVKRHQNQCPNPECEEPFTFRPLDDAKEIDRNETETEEIVELVRTWECSECGYSEKRPETHTFEKQQEKEEDLLEEKPVW